MKNNYKNIDFMAQIIKQLTPLVSEHKQKRVEEILDQRTDHVAIILENVFQPHNINAVLRSAECFGVSQVHIIEHGSYKKFQNHVGISRGATDWIELAKHESVEECIKALKEQGYRIIATSPHMQDCVKPQHELKNLPINQPVALLFGTEVSGISDQAIELADGFTTIPMYGFTESFNISVSAAIALYDLCTRLRASDINWHLTDTRKTVLRYQWYKSIVRGADELERLWQAQENSNKGSAL
ncbi:MAG: rRNA methylase [candidate division TM6 bacterium GW2011_GWE2_41_16]|nr:MAG: rRNA methylase [candidate division TM6 bacterium GW2011_GWE2_41_16]